ncbi:carbohydrate kinase [Brachybacterium endophyticum]|uniref:Carbohydrate kinase n=1 Tax=Brachybacterium endophyticum TaxID=2182385 RepID=A0A2U2RPX9_9MICO|nr:carbohydrate kinase [Brachybacterium endophyticum]PWH07855.1 carbohydrate kinase [Brachybacterium endophyticum]
MKATFLTVGEALTDIVVRPGQEPAEYPGGSPMNVAVTLGRLGHVSHLLTRIGRDDRGRAIREHVESSRVHLTAGSLDDTPTSTARATIDADGSAQYTFDLAWDPDPRGLPEQLDAVHTSSIAAVLAPGSAVVAEVLDRCRPSAILSYDPNARPDLMGDPARVRPVVEDLISRCDIVKSSDEDIAWLYGTDDVEDVAASWRDLGPSVVAMTRGGEGAVGFGAAGRIEIAPVRVDVADTVGAGDTYSAGILHALASRDLLGAARREALAAMDPDDLRQVLEEAAALAAITVSRPGADPPWNDELGSTSRPS